MKLVQSLVAALVYGSCISGCPSLMDSADQTAEAPDVQIVQVFSGDETDPPTAVVTDPKAHASDREFTLGTSDTVGPENIVAAASVSRGLLTVATFDGTLSTWDLENGLKLGSTEFHRHVDAMAWSNDGNTLATAAQTSLTLESMAVRVLLLDRNYTTIATSDVSIPAGDSPVDSKQFFISWAATDAKVAVSWASAGGTADGAGVLWNLKSGAQTPIPYSRAFFVSDDALYANTQSVQRTGPQEAYYGPVQAFLVHLDAGTDAVVASEPVWGAEFVLASDASLGWAVLSTHSRRITLSASPWAPIQFYDASMARSSAFDEQFVPSAPLAISSK